MDVFSTELGIPLSFVKTSEFQGWGFEPRHATAFETVLPILSL
jgi:hypothetical protein